MNVTPVLEVIRQKIGLNPESIGTASVEEIILEHMETSGSNSVDDYLDKINESPAEFTKLVESVVILETFFFRNRISFLALQNYLERFVLNERRGRPVRILCIPCSTGEEPYSVAMALLDMKLLASQFTIHAGDISEQALQFARIGIYSPYSFRGGNLDFRETYFLKQGNSYILKKEVREAVHFERGNILSGHLFAGHEPYDIIFCRNLLIYFDDETKEKAMKAISEHLSGSGVLFVGHAEGTKISQFGYMGLDYPMSFAFAMPEYANAINEALKLNKPLKMVFRPADRVLRPAITAQPSAKITPVTDRPEIHGPAIAEENKNAAINSPEDKSIATAKRLADEGAFSEVIVLCERLLSQGDESAEAYYLLGWAVDSRGESLMAEEYLKKAIYLKADFYEALNYLTLLLDRMGSPERAAAMRRRAERVKLRSSASAVQ